MCGESFVYVYVTAHAHFRALLYGAGLRLRECLRLRVKDVDFGQRHLVVREGKGGRDRVTIFPEVLRAAGASPRLRAAPIRGRAR